MPRKRTGNGRPTNNVRAFNAEAPWCVEVISSPYLLLNVSLKGPTSITEPVSLLPSGRRSPPPKLLSSDDESSQPAVPNSLRSIPHFYPNLPPKHTYLRTPVRILFKAMTITFYPPFIAIATKETSVTVSREETKKCESRSRIVAKPSVGDRGRRWTGRWGNIGRDCELGRHCVPTKTMEAERIKLIS